MAGGGCGSVLGADSEGSPAAGVAVVLLEELAAGRRSAVLVIAVESRRAHKDHIAGGKGCPGVHHQGRIVNGEGDGGGGGVEFGGARGNNLPEIAIGGIFGGKISR